MKPELRWGVIYTQVPIHYFIQSTHVKHILCSETKGASTQWTSLKFNGSNFSGPRASKIYPNSFERLKELFVLLQHKGFGTDQQRCAQRELGFPGVDHWRGSVLNPHIQCLCTPVLFCVPLGRTRKGFFWREQELTIRGNGEFQLPTVSMLQGPVSLKAMRHGTKRPTCNSCQRDKELAVILWFKHTGTSSWQVAQPDWKRKMF